MSKSQTKRLKRHIAANQEQPGGSALLDEVKVYIGLNDMESKEQKLETDHYISILKKLCQSYGVPFSFSLSEGGYIHDDGEYTEERSIVLTFIDVPEETIDEVASDVCILFHQESVLVTYDQIRMKSIRATL